MAETKIDREHLSIADALQQLNVDSKIGLSEAEAAQWLLYSNRGRLGRLV